jgi:signal transduction histidine kinase
LDLLGLPAALGELVQGWSQRFGVPANYHAVATDVAVASETASNLYRIVQEALHNIYKHAHATNVSVLLDAHDGTLTVCIEDDGCGFTTGDSPDVAHTHNLGLISMRERTKLIGGEVDIDSAPGQGTSISVHVPLGTSDTESLQRVR